MKYNLKSILAYVPQNNEGKQILLQSLFFQKALEMRIFILNLRKPTTLFFQKLNVKRNQIQPEKEKEKLTGFIKDAIQEEIPRNIIPFIQTGKIVPVLIQQSKKGGYEFMIVDKSESDYAGALNRSSLLKIISKANCPVLTLNRYHPVNKISKIVIPIDISQTTKKRLFWATLFAKMFNAQIQIVSALNVDMSEAKSLAYKNAEKIKEMLTGRNIKCDIKILKVHQQETHRVILNYIEEVNPDLVIIRTHQESILSGSKIGKFVEEIVFGCKMPVFTVNYVSKLVSPEIN